MSVFNIISVRRGLDLSVSVSVYITQIQIYRYSQIGIDIIHGVVTAGFVELHIFLKHSIMEFTILYVSLCCYIAINVLLRIA